MKKDIFEKWIAALRSKKYHQTKKFLKKDKCFCPIGLLCEISQLGFWKEDPYIADVYYYDTKLPITNRSIHFAPDKVSEWTGSSRSNFGMLSAYVSAMNDNGFSFEEIADQLEARYKSR